MAYVNGSEALIIQDGSFTQPVTNGVRVVNLVASGSSAPAYTNGFENVVESDGSGRAVINGLRQIVFRDAATGLPASGNGAFVAVKVDAGGGAGPVPSVFGNGLWDDTAAWNDTHIWKDAP